MLFQVTKYQGKWSVFDSKTCVYYFIGCSKRFCDRKAKELNSESKSW